MTAATLALAEQLISRPSVTPQDAGCLELIVGRLEPMGFKTERLTFGSEPARVCNLWAKRTASNAGPTLVWAGHTDVVPTGPVAEWLCDPFVPTHRDGKLYGRGASDMKTSLAAFVVATEEFLQTYPDTPLNIAFLLTSDEEGPAIDGTVAVCRLLAQRQEQLDFCIVGEPTAEKQTGDIIKNGRRGSLSGKLSLRGIQGHVAYPQLARNPIHQFAPALAELCATSWDNGNEFFPPTTFQISNIHAGAGVGNVIPGTLMVDFNFRFCTESTPDGLKTRMTELLNRHGLTYELDWVLSGLPFLTPPGPLVEAVRAAVFEETGLQPELSTNGGTSDGRFIAQICPQVVEVGPPNSSIHKVNEHIQLSDIEPLKNIYRRILVNLQHRAA
jgi:succinyl-diaminopimelate desuccinylase